jgi:LPXTG-motif cell wall-anchored protein
MVALALSLFTFAGQASAWVAPTLTALCAPDTTHFAWSINLQTEADQRIEMSWGGSTFVTFQTTDFGTAGAHSFTTLRGGTTLMVRYASDHNAMTSAAGKTEVCAGAAGGGPTPPPNPTPTPTPAGGGTTVAPPPETQPSEAAEARREAQAAAHASAAAPAQAVAGVQTPPSVVGAVMPIVAAPVANAAPRAVQGVQGLPSTSTDSAPFPLAAVGLALMTFGAVLLRRRNSRT